MSWSSNVPRQYLCWKFKIEWLWQNFDELFKNLEKEVMEWKDLASSNNANQIKGERQPLDLNDALDFISNKFHDFERDGLEKENIVKDFKKEVSYLRVKVDDITMKTDRQEQYSRKNCLLIQGIPENNNENTYVLAWSYNTKQE